MNEPEVTRNDVEWSRSGIILLPPITRVFCPFHCVWEDVLDDDDQLCEWCCQYKPCAMHDELWQEHKQDADIVIIDTEFATATWEFLTVDET